MSADRMPRWLGRGPGLVTAFGAVGFTRVGLLWQGPGVLGAVILRSVDAVALSAAVLLFRPARRPRAAQPLLASAWPPGVGEVP